MTFNYQKQYYSVDEVKNIVELETEEKSRIIAQYQDKVLGLIDEIKMLQENMQFLITEKTKKITKTKKK
jgi:hypothetical protein